MRINAQEKDEELAGTYAAEYWQYDSRLGRRWNVDPVTKPHECSYAAFANNPIWFVDPNGADTSFAQSEEGLSVQKDFNDAIDELDRATKLLNVKFMHLKRDPKWEIGL
jgi:RHS repeat-associated protein